jgi:sulfur relay (sulfurtransferase) complex TusBCD TusD component (DsrE family)
MSFAISNLLACATCMSGRGEAGTDAAGAAIIFMLLILCVVLGGVIQFMRYLSRCERISVSGGKH